MITEDEYQAQREFVKAIGEADPGSIPGPFPGLPGYRAIIALVGGLVGIGVMPAPEKHEALLTVFERAQAAARQWVREHP